MSDDKITNIRPDDGRPLETPQRLEYPAYFGLLLATSQLFKQYGRVGAHNILIEMAEIVGAGEDPLLECLRGAKRIREP